MQASTHSLCRAGVVLLVVALAGAADQRLPRPAGVGSCGGNLLSNGFFNKEQLDSLQNAFVMALLCSDAYPATLLGGSNAKYNTLRYEAAVRKRWAALGARTVEFVDDSEDNMEAHALVAATATDVFVSFRGTSTTEGWGANVRLSPWKVAAGNDGKLVQVHGGFLRSFASVYPRVGMAVAKALEQTVDTPSTAKVYIAGHSLGGAHAMLTALALSDNGARIGGVWTFAAPKVGKQDFVDVYMLRFGAITFRWINGLDLVPTLPPELPKMEPFKQLPADQTLWRTIRGQCVKASGPLLLDCPPGYGGDRDRDEERKGKRKKEERCTYSVGDHRLYKALNALGSCVTNEAQARGDSCTPLVIKAILPDKEDQ